MLDTLTDAQKFALSALLEVQSPSTVGDFVSETDEGDFVVSYRFATTLPGYPGWNWTIVVARLPNEEPTIVESELLPAEGALLAPDWVPWSDRMDDYRAAQLALGESDSITDEDDDDDEDAFGSDTLHGGDLDGVDIDEIDDSSDAVDDLSDPGSGPLDLQINEGDQAQAEGDSGSENPPRVPRRRKRASKEQQDDQGD